MKNLPNCVIAEDMALRMGANPPMVCQNLYIVHGRSAWSEQFLINPLSHCGRFTSIRYEFQSEEGKDEWGCRAVALEGLVIPAPDEAVYPGREKHDAP